ncbi:cation transport ATPase [Bacteroides graminisolvens DSM 19988 = JCM 15093]|uniref:Cation transport ATPase n=1 Tax=Bacteroides graminisolvens DSM 19988 = JCM 15093 TaxID=1121097 RepID=A0A069CYA2_9BACE|nr:cation-transporting P-type ATPase [Bacteroides graminisolvens]GAK35016.1 cation transport ATPase [Bacteroides graminisolvens DSM 19988 = JCM 15093]
MESTDKFNGLTQQEAQDRLLREGYNELHGSNSRNFYTIMLGVIKEPMFLLLVACGALYMILGDTEEGIMLLSFVFVVMGIEFYQERKSEKALEALKDMASPRACYSGRPRNTYSGARSGL